MQYIEPIALNTAPNECKVQQPEQQHTAHINKILKIPILDYAANLHAFSFHVTQN